MIFDELGLPIEDNASDKQDSARLAGLLAVVEWPRKVDLTQYCNLEFLTYVRHPKEYVYDFSRDQLVCLLAGIRKTERNHFWLTLKANGKDFIPPSVNGLRTLQPNFLQKLWAKADVIAHALFTPLSESNQVICIADAYGLLPLWTKLNKRWRESVTIYWVTTRGRPEPELAEHIIKYVESRI
jgi:hypothetical protein